MTTISKECTAYAVASVPKNLSHSSARKHERWEDVDSMESEDKKFNIRRMSRSNFEGLLISIFVCSDSKYGVELSTNLIEISCASGWNLFLWPDMGRVSPLTAHCHASNGEVNYQQVERSEISLSQSALQSVVNGSQTFLLWVEHRIEQKLQRRDSLDTFNHARIPLPNRKQQKTRSCGHFSASQQATRWRVCFFFCFLPWHPSCLDSLAPTSTMVSLTTWLISRTRDPQMGKFIGIIWGERLMIPRDYLFGNQYTLNNYYWNPCRYVLFNDAVDDRL